MSTLFWFSSAMLLSGLLAFLSWSYLDYRRMRGGRWW